MHDMYELNRILCRSNGLHLLSVKGIVHDQQKKFKLIFWGLFSLKYPKTVLKHLIHRKKTTKVDVTRDRSLVNI